MIGIFDGGGEERMKGTNKYVEHWNKDKRDSGNCFRNYNGNYTEREEKYGKFQF